MFLSELSQGEAGVAFEVLAEGRLVGESEAVGQLLEGLVGGEQHVLYFAHHEVVENLLGEEATLYLWMNTQEQFRYTRLQLIASVVNAYYTLVILDEQLRISEQSAQLQQTADWLELQQGKINLYKALCR